MAQIEMARQTAQILRGSPGPPGRDGEDGAHGLPGSPNAGYPRQTFLNMGMVPNDLTMADENSALWAALMATTPINSMSNTGWAVAAEPGVWYFDKQLGIPASTHLFGDAPGQPGSTILAFPNGYGGVSIAPGAYETTIENLGLYSPGRTVPTPIVVVVPNGDFPSNVTGWFSTSGHSYLNGGTSLTWQSGGGVGGSSCCRMTCDGTQTFQGMLLGPTYLPYTFSGGESVTVKVSLKSISGNTNLVVGCGDANQLGGWSETSVVLTGSLVEYTAVLTMPAPTSQGVVYLRHSTAAARTVDVDHWTVSVSPSGHGIHAQSKCDISRCYVSGFRENGIYVQGGGGVQNANCFSVDKSFVSACGGHGLHVIGNDANAGAAWRTTLSGNLGDGLREDSFLGNNYHDIHVENSGGMDYRISGGVNASTFYGCYSEGGSGHIEGTAIWVGGSPPNWDASSAGFRINPHGGIVDVDPQITITNRAHATHPSITIGDQVGIGDGRPIVQLDQAESADTPIGVGYNTSGGGEKEWQVGLLRWFTSLSPSHVRGVGYLGQGEQWIHLPQGFITGPYPAQHVCSNAPPTSGKSKVGDIVFASNANASGKPTYWYCKVDGNNDGTPTASVWVPMGILP